MLPHKRRIVRKEFAYILKNGKRYNSSHLLLYVAPLPKTSDLSRFSFSISKKIYKNATDRNRYRRRGYSVISPIISLIPPGFLCFFSFKKGVYPLSFQQLQEEIVGLLKNSQLLT